MTISLNIEHIRVLAPNAKSGYQAASKNAQKILDQYKISDSHLRLCHFLAQILHETGGFTIQEENLNYSPQRLPEVWPKRFKPLGKLDPYDYAYNPEKLANEVYGNRMGNNQEGDGYRYRGRGLLQLTGKESYKEATTIVRHYQPSCPDFVENPDQVFSAEWSLHVAAAEWDAKGCNTYADQDDIVAVTQAINGGQIGILSRREWLDKVKGVVKPPQNVLFRDNTNKIKISVERFISDNDTTVSHIKVDGKLICFGLEDEYREVKLAKETRIPSGKYRIGLRKEGRHHSQYQQIFPSIHQGMLHILDVPGFEYILIHCGNTESETDGCLLVGTDASLTPGSMSVSKSRDAYRLLYPIVVNAAAANTLEIEYIDLDHHP